MTEFNRIEITESDVSGTFDPSRRRSDPFAWARQRIRERMNKRNRIPFFYKDCLRFIINQLGTLAYLNSEDQIVDVKCVHANPERTIAKLTQETNIILPIISINQSTSEGADGRRRQEDVIVQESYWSESRKRAFRLISFAPQAVNIEYSINIWSKYKSDLDQLVEQIRLLFNPALVMANSQTTTAKAFIEMEVDQSSIEVDDREDRVLRRAFIVKLEGYIPNPKFLITSTGQIEEFNLDSTLY